MTRQALRSERTDQGEQTLVPGVAPITLRNRLDLLAALPMAAKKPQKPCNVGLFDEVARAQLDFFTYPAGKGPEG